MLRYDTVLFDADNTLLDFTRSEHDAILDTLRFAGIEPSEEMVATYSAINDCMWKRLERGEISKTALREARFAEFAAHYGFSLNVPRIALAYTEFLSQKSYLIDGMEAVCRTLVPHCRLYVITNGLKTVQERRFGASPLAPLFLDAFISEEIGAEKPSLRYFEEVARRIPDFSPIRTLVVGDSLTSDMQGGIRAGLDTCWFNPGGKPAPSDIEITYTVRKPEELLPLVLGR